MSVFDHKEQWLTRRKGGIGGTDISAILGLNPWKNALDVWLAKLGLAEQQEPTEAMWWGTYLESGIARKYAEQTNSRLITGPAISKLFHESRCSVWHEHTVIEHERHNFLIGTPDALVLHDDRGLEIKNTSFQGREWGRPGTDEVPHHYLLQCAWYMALTGLNHWDVAVLFNGTRMEIYRVRRNAELEAALIEAGTEFWRKFILTKTPPPIDGSIQWAQHLARQFRIGNEQIIQASDEAEQWAVRLRDAQEQIERYQEIERSAKNHLCALVGENKGMRGAFGKATWVRPKPSKETDWEALAKSFSPTLEKIEEFTQEKPKTAYLRVTFAEKQETAA